MPDTWLPGFGPSLDYPEVGVPAILAGSARRFGDRPAFVHEGERITFRELGQAAAAFANGLLADGLSPGDPVALRMPNCLAYPVAYYGTLLAGGTFVPVSPLLPEPAARAQLTDAGAVRSITAADVPKLCAGQSEAPPEVEVDLYDHLAHLAYTGGTTGVSKGVELPHRNVVVNSLQYACWATGSMPALDEHGGLVLDQIGGPEEWPTRLGTGIAINLTPWFHAMGTIGGLNVPVLSGLTVVLHSRLDPAAYLADVERLGVTSMGGAPALFAALLMCPDVRTRDLSSVRSISSGAAPMPLEMIHQLNELLPGAPILEGYGLTEVTMGATSTPSHRSGLHKAGAVGRPVFDTEVRLASLDGDDAPVPAGERGEVCVRGPQVMRGYHNRPEATAEVLRDGWLHTGDIGVLDDDGYLSIVDRKKDMLLYKGYNVYPRELEELLVALPEVAAAAVVGRPDPAVGELPVAFVVPAKASVSDADVLDAVNAQVPGYKRVRELRFVPELPVSAAGKILKRALREQLT
ncbi:class I adenylate-forming enzyme family protein [Amycolatopsis sp. 195334CR]|uniref:class I adenylate-forming enzyme family protein n=1 Tax=Amycolatopsis sp. 195334CR TaxID=2814588 RepID=UPI001A904CC7|nr:AMP-binding protein [Amycolatopsis sp. 195334CR]MBN6039396.1 AMP-binding protein [Amycolatopsis sp. 195334CR]